VERALASFERTVLSGDSPFDRYEYGGDKSALTAAQIRGLAIFTDPNRGNCSACHSVNDHYALFTDGIAHNIGIGVGDDGTLIDSGRFHTTGIEADRGAFITPTLRNVANTAPYMHDGSLKTLKDVVDFYAGGGNSNPYLDRNIRAIRLSARDRQDLVEFLKSLTGVMPQDVGPPAKE
jgi:cytochrome c peroxidase